MKPLILGSLILLAAIPGSAASTLPPAVVARLKPGRRLNRVWISPAFRAEQGVRIGPVRSQLAGPYADVQDYVPAALERLARPDAGNVLAVTLTGLAAHESPDKATAALEAEGQVLDPDGNPLVAFSARQTCSGPGTIRGNSREAVDQLVTALAKELGLPMHRPAYLVRAAKPAQAQPPAAAPEQTTPPTPAAEPPAPLPAQAGSSSAPPQAEPNPVPAPSKPDEPSADQPEDPQARGHHY